MVRIEHVTAQDAVTRFKSPLVHVFASARVPGGGWRSGVAGQEEDLCRASDLGHRLETDAESAAFYEAGERAGPLNTDLALLMAGVRLHRTGHIFHALLCAAPQAAHYYPDRSVIRAAFSRRIRNIIAVAEALQNPLILGAWGCGHFRNDPCTVAEELVQAAKETDLDILFAIPDRFLVELFLEHLSR
jgi:uncharacterized protein (TIGR02452 family)